MKNANDDRSDEAAGMNHDAEQVGHHNPAQKNAVLPAEPASQPGSPGRRASHDTLHDTSHDTTPAASIGPE